jgi:ferrous iron transport protein B
MHSDVNSEKIIVGVVGAPNAGKTTLYNWLTGSNYKPVNYPGSTVEYALGVSLPTYGDTIHILDTPGIYSLNAQSPEEEVTYDVLYRDGLKDGTRDHARPGTIVAVVDSTQLARHLFLTKQLLESGYQVVVAVTMLDLLKKRGLKIDTEILGRDLGIPVVAVDGRLGGGVRELMQEVRKNLAGSNCPTDFVPWTKEKVESVYGELDQLANRAIVTIEGAKAPVRKVQADAGTLKLDQWLMHPILGLIFFILILGTLFSSIFWLAQPVMDLIDSSFSAVGDWITSTLPPSLFSEFISSGLIAGMGSVAVFVPQIFILFMGLVFLEDWGYLSRAAALIDRPLSKIGLNGRSFVPMLSGFACAIPAMMAARTIGSRRERMITLFIIPLMSCSARLPVYALLLAYLFKDGSALTAGFALAGIYLMALVVGLVMAGIAAKVLKSNEPSWFMLELPTYRRPRLNTVLRSAFDRTTSYLKNAGPAILVFSLIIWVATVFPNYQIENKSERLAQSYAAQAGQFMTPIMEPMGADWRIGVGLISAFAAREVFVASLALIFNLTDVDDDTLQDSLLGTMRAATHPDGSLLFTTSTIIGLVIFFMIALQCLSTVAVAKKETGSWKFASIQLALFTVLAWVAAVGVVQGLRLIGVA